MTHYDWLNLIASIVLLTSKHLPITFPAVYYLTFQLLKIKHTNVGGIAKPKQKNSVIGLFRRESSVSESRDSDTSLTQTVTPVVMRNKRSASISGTGIGVIESGGHSGQFPVTASHRRNTRKGSLLEISG
jgi:hypothetical protein